MNKRDIFLITLFISIIVFREMHTRGILTMDMLQNVFSGNVASYAVVAVALSFFRQPGANNELERTLLALNNELQKMRAENEWRNDVISQGKHARHSPQSAVRSPHMIHCP
jgi:hypothetical protein